MGAHRPPSTQVLTNADLVYPIFTFISSDNLKSSLAQCATVCRTFHEPAIQVLWRNLRSLLPLWHLLAPTNTSFDANYYSTTRYDVLRYLQEVGILVSTTVGLAHNSLGHLCATIS